MDWTDETIARLRELWSQGLSTAEIGRQLSITKNAVVGKAHRLALPARPSPIRNRPAKDGEGAEGAPKRKSSRAAKAAVPEAESAEETLFSGKPPVAEPAAAPPAREAESGAPSRAELRAPVAPVSSAASETIRAPVVRRPVASDGVSAPQPAPSTASSRPTSVSPRPVAPTVEASAPPAAASRPTANQSAPVAPAPVSPAPKTSGTKSAASKQPEPKRFHEGVDRPVRRGPSCCWPFGDPGKPGFHFCGARPLPNKPYCAEHAAIAYVKIRDRREGG